MLRVNDTGGSKRSSSSAEYEVKGAEVRNVRQIEMLAV
jgi:hypothetical protein